MDAILCAIPGVLQALFEVADALALDTGFVRRRRKLQPAAFARAFCLFLIRYPRASLEQLAARLDITPSALCQRLRAPAAAEFMLLLLRHALDRLGATLLRPVAIPLLRRFNGVYLVDSSSLALPASLACRFAGCGGGAGGDDPSALAAVKIFLRFRLDASQAAAVLLDAARTPDVETLRRLDPLPAGALHIGDLGFFDSRYFAELTEQGVYWLTRLPARLCVRDQTGEWLELAPWLEALQERGCDRWDGPLELARLNPVRARVFVLRCPPAEQERRRRHLRQRLRRKGKEPGQRQLILCDWWVLATNAPPELLQPCEAWELYRSRWQIELVFKRWKSLGGLAIDRHYAAVRAECALYGKLIGVLLVDWLALQRGGVLAGVSAWHAWQIVHELLPTICLALQGRLEWSTVLHELAQRLDNRTKQPRRKKRPSTRQRLYRATLGA